MEKRNILIVEDHPFTRQTLSYDLKRAGMNVIAAVENGSLAVDFVKKNAPDVILMDIEMPVLDGIAATKEIKQFNRNIPVIILTSHNEKEKVFGAFSSGANAYCVKKIEIKELLYVIDIVINGGVWFDKQIAGFIFDIMRNSEIKPEEKVLSKKLEDYNISSRERNVLKLIADGLSNAEIADELVISQNTVRNHVANIIDKLAVKDRTQAAIFTLKNNLLD